MSALVIKTWQADTKPIDEKNNFVKIIGREGGLIAWVLSLMGIDPTTTILVGLERIEFSKASLAGTETRINNPTSERMLHLLRLSQTLEGHSLDHCRIRVHRSSYGVRGSYRWFHRKCLYLFYDDFCSWCRYRIDLLLSE